MTQPHSREDNPYARHLDQPPLPAPQSGKAGYVVALIAGIPVTLLMGLWVLASLLDGSLPGMVTLALGGAAATGTVFAIQDLSTGTRGRRTAALLLTLIPAGLLALMFGFLFLVVALVLGGGNPN